MANESLIGCDNGDQEMEISDKEDEVVGDSDSSNISSQNGDCNFLSSQNGQELIHIEDDSLTYEELLKQKVAEYCTEDTQVSERVKAWENKMKHILAEEDAREEFNMHVYRSRVIDSFADNNRKQTLQFSKICKGKSRWEMSRYFIASLALANTNEIGIEVSGTVSGFDQLDLTLLSRKRHQEKRETFGHNSGEHD